MSQLPANRRFGLAPLRFVASIPALALTIALWGCSHDCKTTDPTCRKSFSHDAKLAAFVANSRHIQLPPDADGPSGPSTQTEVDGQTITATPYHATLSVDEIAGFNPNADVQWPGALVQGQSLATGLLAGINVQRAPLQIFITNLGTKGAPPNVSTTVPVPTAATVEQARVDLINRPDLTTPAKFSYTVKEFTSLEQGLLQLGVSASWLSASVKAQLSSEHYSSRHNLLVRFTQEYYTVAAVGPATPTSYFGPSVTRSDLTPYADSLKNPITYVSSVTYGRMALLTVSSSASMDKLRASVEAAVSWATGSASASVSTEQQQILQESETQLLVLGGNAQAAVQAITGDKLAGLQHYIQDGATLSLSSPGYPISYRVNYLSDNAPAKVAFSTDYTRVESSPIPALSDLRILFHTNDDDKDDDTRVTATVQSVNGAVYASFNQIGQRYADQSDNGPFSLTTSAPLYVRDVPNARIVICTYPNGNDTWRFNYSLTGAITGGRSYSMGVGGVVLSGGCGVWALAPAPQ